MSKTNHRSLYPFLTVLTLHTLVYIINSKSASEYRSEQDALIAKINKPLSEVFNGLKQQIRDRVAEIGTFNSMFDKEDPTDTDDIIQSTNSIVDGTEPGAIFEPEDEGLPYYNNIQAYGSDNTGNSEGRMLQSYINGPCQHDGKFVTAIVERYNCAGLFVSLATYRAREGVGCTISNRTRNTCYCSYEFYGTYCENFNSWSCSVEKLSFPDDCEPVMDYDYDYDGFPPCYPVNKGDTVNMETHWTCAPNNASLNYEGVKDPLVVVVSAPKLTNVWTYVINGDLVKLTFQPDVTQVIAFRNWLALSQPVTFKTSLTNAQIQGSGSLQTAITFDSALDPAAFYGRYYYDIFLQGSVSGSTPTSVNVTYAGGFFEQQGYKEPKASYKVKVGVLIGALVGIAVGIGAIAYLIYRRQKKLRKLRRNNSAISPFIGYEEVQNPVGVLSPEDADMPPIPNESLLGEESNDVLRVRASNRISRASSDTVMP